MPAIRETVRKAVERYAVKGINSDAYLTVRPDGHLLTVIDFASDHKGQRFVATSLVVRCVDGFVIKFTTTTTINHSWMPSYKGASPGLRSFWPILEKLPWSLPKRLRLDSLTHDDRIHAYFAGMVAEAHAATGQG